MAYTLHNPDKYDSDESSLVTFTNCSFSGDPRWKDVRIGRLVGEFGRYMQDQVELYRDRFEQEPSEEMMDIFMQRFVQQRKCKGG